MLREQIVTLGSEYLSLFHQRAPPGFSALTTRLGSSPKQAQQYPGKHSATESRDRIYTGLRVARHMNELISEHESLLGLCKITPETSGDPAEMC